MVMRLPDFILSHMESILAHWQAFAATQLPAGASMTVLELRDDAQPILEAIAKDLRTSQTRTEQAQKSMGLAVTPFGAPITAAQTHAVLRAKSGFSIRQLVAEYRALRASVLRLWMDACDPEIPHPEDITRFNEAIDQALAESVDFYTTEVDQSRKLFLATVSHDMRTPLQTIDVAARYLRVLNLRKEVSESASRISRSASELH
ncbi:MAG: histidine kinase dimerization/phospho-acceptor domain-containing protein [Betaproteobacteria bacterium]